MTNSGCESRQANLNRRVKFSGGSTLLRTLPNKEVVAGNKYLSSSSFPAKLSDQLKEFKWARHSKEAKEALGDREKALKRVVFGQDQAIEKLATAMKLSRAGLREALRSVAASLTLRWSPCATGQASASPWARAARALAQALAGQMPLPLLPPAPWPSQPSCRAPKRHLARWLVDPRRCAGQRLLERARECPALW